MKQLAQRADVSGHVTWRELMKLFLAQDARCGVSGRLLRPSARIGDPDGISLILRNPTRPVSERNLLLVTTVVAENVSRWGLDEFLALVQDVHAQVRKVRRSR